MTKLSLHIGVDQTDRSAYPRPFSALEGCINDASAYESIARAAGFEPLRLHNSSATAEAVTAAIESLAGRMVAGDLLFLTFSGHGSQGPDPDSDEPDGLDETWVLYDRQLLDDELWMLWSRFQLGVHIFVVSDSCNSGTVARLAPRIVGVAPAALGAPRDQPPAGARSRQLPADVRDADFRLRADLYELVRTQIPTRDSIRVDATVLLFAACQDGESANEAGGHGLMTSAFVHSWSDGQFHGGYYDLFQAVSGRVRGQTPNYLPLGREDPAFERRKPLT